MTGLLTDRTITDFDAAFSRPTLDNAAGEPEAVNSVAVFPTRWPASRRQRRTGPGRTRRVAQRQKLVLLPGQFSSVSPTIRTASAPRCSTDRCRETSITRLDRLDSAQVGEVVLRRPPGDTSQRSVAASDVSRHPPGGGPLPGGWRREEPRPRTEQRSFVGSLAVPARIANEQIRVVDPGRRRGRQVRGPPTRVQDSRRLRHRLPPSVELSPSTPAWDGSRPASDRRVGPARSTVDMSIDGGPLLHTRAVRPGGLGNGKRQSTGGAPTAAA